MFRIKKRFRRAPSLVKGVFVLTMMALFVFVLGNVIVFLWNNILVEAVGVKPLTFWKAIGLFVLTRILFGGFKSGPRSSWGRRGRSRKEKWRGMSEEERAAFKSKWKERRGGKC